MNDVMTRAELAEVIIAVVALVTGVSTGVVAVFARIFGAGRNSARHEAEIATLKMRLDLLTQWQDRMRDEHRDIQVRLAVVERVLGIVRPSLPSGD